MTEFLRLENVSIGREDDKNFSTAIVRIAGEEAKNAGEQVLCDKTFHRTLAEALQRAAHRTKRAQSAKTIAEYIEALQAATDQIKIAAQDAAHLNAII